LIDVEKVFVTRPILNTNIGKSLYRTHLSGELLEVREQDNYRWFHYGGDVVQAAIDTLNRENVLLPVPQSMLLFLLWQKSSLQVLNLGMGAGTIENALAKLTDIKITSVEAELEIIEMAKRYFLSSGNNNIIHNNAEDFLRSTTQRYDMILCDIFYQQQSPICLYSSSYYQYLDEQLNRSGNVFINLFPENNDNLLRVLTASRPFFDHAALIEFDDYQNIVLILSKVALPNKEQLNSWDNSAEKLLNINFKEHINNIYYVPVRATER
jgi:protein-L-isoaspartate O-methyltransferase